MKYKKLHNFKDIINRRDFDYVSDLDNIKRIEEIIDFGILNPSANDKICIQVLRDFYSNIETFNNSINGQNIELLRKGYYQIKTEIENALNIFVKVRPEDRRIIGRRTIHKIKKRFLLGLSFYYKGLVNSFESSYKGLWSYSREQLSNFILNKKAGLGKIYNFKRIGKHSAYNKIINTLNRDELIIAIKLLQGKSQTRTPNKWIDLGERGTIIRILKVSNNIYFVYRTSSEHRDYERQLNIPPKKVSFVAA